MILATLELKVFGVTMRIPKGKEQSTQSGKEENKFLMQRSGIQPNTDSASTPVGSASFLLSQGNNSVIKV